MLQLSKEQKVEAYECNSYILTRVKDNRWFEQYILQQFIWESWESEDKLVVEEITSLHDLEELIWEIEPLIRWKKYKVEIVDNDED